MKYRENFRASSELSALLDSLHLPTKLQEGVSSFPSNYTIKVYKTIENKGDVELQLVKFHKIFDADPGVITCMNVFEANHSIVLGMDSHLKGIFRSFLRFLLRVTSCPPDLILSLFWRAISSRSPSPIHS